MMPVVVTVRHVRLSAAHLELLFGAGATLVDVCALPPTGTFASASVVDVRGPAGTLRHVRVLGPLVRQTEVRLLPREAGVLGLTAGADSGCTLEGPHGTVVLAGGVHLGLRRLALGAHDAQEAGLIDGAHTGVIVRGDRERELRDVPVHVGEHGGWLEVDVDDANALDVGPHTHAVIAERRERPPLSSSRA